MLWAMPNCLRLFVQLARAAASRTFWTAGSSRPMRMAMIAITTKSSISVKPRQRFAKKYLAMTGPFQRDEGEKKRYLVARPAVPSGGRGGPPVSQAPGERAGRG